MKVFVVTQHKYSWEDSGLVVAVRAFEADAQSYIDEQDPQSTYPDGEYQITEFDMPLTSAVPEAAMEAVTSA